MTYRILFYLVNIFLRVYYRKIYIHGLENIPKNKPLFIVSNHPNGFMEPIMMACLFPIELHFLVRGDLFEKKLLKPLLTSTNQIPIYRFRDGFASLRNNQKTILKTIEVLKGNNAVLIFAEGSTNGEWKLRPLKKGMARMAFQCLDQNEDLDIAVVPVGVTFSNAHLPGTECIIKIGQSFSVKDYYVKNAAQAKEKMEALSDKCHDAMKTLMIHLDDTSKEDEVRQQWQTLHGEMQPPFYPRVVTKDSGLFDALKSYANAINMGKESKTEPVQVKRSETLAIRKDNSHRLLMPIAWIGKLLWFLPLFIGGYITGKYVKQREFISSVELASKGAASLLYLLILGITIAIWVGVMDALLLWLAMMLSGIVYIYVREKSSMVNG